MGSLYIKLRKAPSAFSQSISKSMRRYHKNNDKIQKVCLSLVKMLQLSADIVQLASIVVALCTTTYAILWQLRLF